MTAEYFVIMLRGSDNRLRAISVIFILLAVAIIARLFILQIIQHDYYAAFASGAHEVYKKLYPRRGEIFFQDARDGAEYPAAMNKQYYNIYAVPQEIKPADAPNVSELLAELLFLSADDKALLAQKISKGNDPYEPLAKKIGDETAAKIRGANLQGIYAVGQDYRYYPENNVGAHLLGFWGLDRNANPAGLYGIEGYWEHILAGQGGFLSGLQGAKGGLIASAGRVLKEAENGADIVLTVDRALEYQACERLKKGMEEFQAASAALVMMEPASGAVLAMCGSPDFNPNEYSKVEDVGVYNNTAIFTPYEPGSVFKPLIIAAAIDANLVKPETAFQDPCERKIDNHTLHNAMNKCYGRATMTQVLENSINTGMIWVAEQLGPERFKESVAKMGFGEKTGIALDTEAAGDISALDKKGKIWSAVASYGQGITVTPLQLAVAYSALANGGQLVKPQVAAETRYPNGRRVKMEAEVVQQIFSPATVKLVTAMLISVVEKGHSRPARLDEYYMAAKTGTAEIAGKGGYTEETNHTFAGYVPANNPKFVLVVKFEKPRKQWAESTAAPVFKDIAEFALKYYGVKGDR